MHSKYLVLELEMKEKEITRKDSIEYLLDSLLLCKNGDCGNTRLAHEQIEPSASPEEGVLLIRAFIRIKQPELRAASIKLATQIADARALTMPIQN
jgi:hypothetical protein